jgi:hypothetical protein
LAAAVVSLILLRRRALATDSESTLPNPQSLPTKPSPGPGKNRSGDLDEAARAARTQPHGPPPRSISGGTSRPEKGTPPSGTGLVPTAPVELGKWGEARLRQALNGLGYKPKTAFKTSLTRRFVDWMLDGVGHEAKAGLNVGLNRRIREQALKDAELIEKGKIDGAHWHFFQGAQQELLDFLSSLGIQYTVY